MAYTPIDKSTDYFNTSLWTGNAAEAGDGSTQAITGVGFTPDWIWIKKRSATGNHHLIDAPRGITKELRANLTNAEADDDQLITAFGSDGFTLGSSGSGNLESATYVGWTWKANGAGATNEDGSINTTKTSASTTSGFSISTYTGTGSAATIGHGLGVAPSVMIVKRKNSTGDWVMYHKSLGNGKNMRMNESGVEDTSSAPWNATTPTSSVFSVGAFGETNGSSDTFVAYCMAEVQGFSKFNSYLGNASTDGTFVYTGFKPAWVMIKRSSTTGDNWLIHDSKRAGYNDGNKEIKADQTNAEGDSRLIDILSNGFKIIINDAKINASGDTYIYLAFAESPFVSSSGIPTTAR